MIILLYAFLLSALLNLYSGPNSCVIIKTRSSIKVYIQHISGSSCTDTEDRCSSKEQRGMLTGGQVFKTYILLGCWFFFYKQMGRLFLENRKADSRNKNILNSKTTTN